MDLFLRVGFVYLSNKSRSNSNSNYFELSTGSTIQSGLTFYLGYWLVKESQIWTSHKLTLHAKIPYIRGPYKWAQVYF